MRLALLSDVTIVWEGIIGGQDPSRVGPRSVMHFIQLRTADLWNSSFTNGTLQNSQQLSSNLLRKASKAETLHFVSDNAPVASAVPRSTPRPSAPERMVGEDGEKLTVGFSLEESPASSRCVSSLLTWSSRTEQPSGRGREKSSVFVPVACFLCDGFTPLSPAPLWGKQDRKLSDG